MSVVITHPRLAELVERRKLRMKVERAVARLIDLLDELDADPEAEPSLGASIVLQPAHDDQRCWARGTTDDREEEDEHADDLDRGEHDPCDLEPGLVAAEGHVDQTRWSQGAHRIA